MLSEHGKIENDVARVERVYNFTWFDRFCLWYPPGWLILFNRHWQHYHSDPDGWNGLEYILFLIPGGFYLALLIRWLHLGCRAPQRRACQFDQSYQEAFRNEVLAPIVKYYFQAELKEVENLPPTGPLIVAMNHAGMCFPWDFLVLGYLLSKARGWVVQPLADVSLFNHPWINWWLPPEWAQVLGGVQAEADSFEAVFAEPSIAEKTILLYAPEGLHGPAKGWGRRYQLQTFYRSFIRLSQRFHIPILPVVCIGSESLHSWAVNVKPLAKRLRLPFLPVSFLMLAFLFFPSMGIWAMRSRLRYYIQPVYNSEVAEVSSQREVLTAYQQAQKLRDMLQSKIQGILLMGQKIK